MADPDVVLTQSIDFDSMAVGTDLTDTSIGSVSFEAPGSSPLSVIEAATDNGEDFTVHRLGLPDSFLEHATLKELRAELGIDADGIGAAVKKVLAGGRLQKG